MSTTNRLASSRTGAKYVVNNVAFTCVYDALEYREHLDAHYIKVVWRNL